MYEKQNEERPAWFSGGKINEAAFCNDFLRERKLCCAGGRFYGENGEIPDEDMTSEVYSLIKELVPQNAAARAESIIKALKLECRISSLPAEMTEIPLLNGSLDIFGTFRPTLDICTGRLGVPYNADVFREKQYPKMFLKFLWDMLEEDDISTLQEYLGYCLIPCTKGQTAMFITGNGGEGKSVIGIVLREIFGSLMLTGNFQRVETDRFFRYNLEGKLLMLDDDMQLSALPSTGTIKSLITSEIPTDIEAKGKQSRQAALYCRFLCLGNGSPRALYDRSDGFARRLIILSCKPKPRGRAADPFLPEKLIKEKEQIFFWMYNGLSRLIDNGFRFTVSEKSKQNADAARSESCNIIDFLSDKGFVSFGEGYKTSSAELYGSYTEWCLQNGLTPLKSESVTSWLKSNEDRYNIKYDTHIKNRNGKNVRGFIGIKTCYSAFIS